MKVYELVPKLIGRYSFKLDTRIERKSKSKINNDNSKNDLGELER